MIITVNDFLEIPIARDGITPDHKYFLDEMEMFAGNTKLMQGNEIKQKRWDMITESLTPEQAFSVGAILAGLGDYWDFDDDTFFSSRGQRAKFETDVANPDDPITISGAFGSSVRLNDYDMILRVYLEPNYLISFYRQDVEFDAQFFHYIVDDFERVWINGEEASEEEIEEHGIFDWMDIDFIENEITFYREAGDIDEVYVMSGVVYDGEIINPMNIYEMGELPINTGVLKVEGNFLDDEDYIEVTCEVDLKEYRGIGTSVDVEFRIEEDI